MNSAVSIPEAPTVANPEAALSYDEYMQSKHPWWNQYKDDFSGNTLKSKIIGLFTDASGRFRDEYQTYLNNLNLRNERKATQSAQAYDEYMSNTAYSRAFADLERAGINPYLLLNSGSTPSTSVGSASKPSYQASKTGIKNTSSNTAGRDLALIMLAIARLVAAL